VSRRNGNTGKTHCIRGHQFIGANIKAQGDRDRRCRACECAISAVHNWLRRKGVPITEAAIKEYADRKYATLV